MSEASRAAHAADAAHGRRLVSAPGWRGASRALLRRPPRLPLSVGCSLSEFRAIPARRLLADPRGARDPVALPLVQTQRWRLIAATLGARVGFGAAAKNVYIGQLFNQILPSSIGGDAVRVWKLAPAMPVHLAVSSVALDRIVALLTVPIILTIGCGMLLSIVPPGPFRWSLVAMIALIACGFATLSARGPYSVCRGSSRGCASSRWCAPCRPPRAGSSSTQSALRRRWPCPYSSTRPSACRSG